MKRIVSKVFLVLSTIICLNMTAGTPKIAMSGKTKLDFGTFAANQEPRDKIDIVNNGDAELIIKNIRETCGCAARKISSKKIAPGKKATLTISLKKNSMSGPFSKAVYVESNDPKTRFLYIPISGNAVPLVKIYPKKYLYMGTLKTGKPYEFKFRIEALKDGVKLELAKPKANFPIETELKESKQKNYMLSVTATPDKVSRLLSAELEIKILSPKDWKPLKIKLRGRSVK